MRPAAVVNGAPHLLIGGSMPCNLKAIIRSLRAKGWRLTPQRQMLLEVLHQAEGHIDAETIWSILAERFPSISLSTVYRSLEDLCEMGAATETDMGRGRVQYHLASHGGHHHLICRKCGAVIDVPDDAVESLRQSLLAQYGFRIEGRHLALHGTCSNCA